MQMSWRGFIFLPRKTFHYSVSGLVKRAQFGYWDERQAEKKLEQWLFTRHGLSSEMSNEVIYLSAGACFLICEILQIPSVHSVTFFLNTQMGPFRKKRKEYLLFVSPIINHIYCQKWTQEIH